ncbi:hypothetical protein P0D88_34025 [Paraburkholderia sp. RL18-103-BIB-C]|uniref:hypothetical protein n=1 Tax=unclassified Paraburkholderia TaxID=2615204 RepID=UPI0038BD89DB
MKIQSNCDRVAVTAPLQKRVRNYLIAEWTSMAGIEIEWYDFFLSGAALVRAFVKRFFPTLDPIWDTVTGFATSDR